MSCGVPLYMTGSQPTDDDPMLVPPLRCCDLCTMRLAGTVWRAGTWRICDECHDAVKYASEDR